MCVAECEKSTRKKIFVYFRHCRTYILSICFLRMVSFVCIFSHRWMVRSLNEGTDLYNKCVCVCVCHVDSNIRRQPYNIGSTQSNRKFNFKNLNCVMVFYTWYLLATFIIIDDNDDGIGKQGSCEGSPFASRFSYACEIIDTFIGISI